MANAFYGEFHATDNGLSMHRLSLLIAGSALLLCTVVGHTSCCGANGCCPVSYPDATVAAALAPQAINISSTNVIGSSDNQVFLEANQAFITITVNSNNFVVPLYRYGCSNLYFCQVAHEGLVFDGWIPVVFDPTDPLIAAYFACNSLPVLPRRTRIQIAELYFPISCSASRPG